MVNRYCDREKQHNNCNKQYTKMFADIRGDNERNDSDNRLVVIMMMMMMMMTLMINVTAFQAGFSCRRGSPPLPPKIMK